MGRAAAGCAQVPDLLMPQLPIAHPGPREGAGGEAGRGWAGSSRAPASGGGEGSWVWVHVWVCARACVWHSPRLLSEDREEPSAPAASVFSSGCLLLTPMSWTWGTPSPGFFRFLQTVLCGAQIISNEGQAGAAHPETSQGGSVGAGSVGLERPIADKVASLGSDSLCLHAPACPPLLRRISPCGAAGLPAGP